MRLGRKQSLILSMGTIILFFVLAILFSGERRSSGSALAPPLPEIQDDLGQAAAETGESQFVLNDFHRSETRDGRKLWEVKADRGQYFPEKNAAVLQQAKLWFYKENGDQVQLQAKNAELFFSVGSLDKALLSSGVTLVFNDRVNLQTERADYVKETHSVHAPGAVQIESDIIHISGEMLDADIDKRVVTISKNVESVITPKKQGSKEGQ